MPVKIEQNTGLESRKAKRLQAVPEEVFKILTASYLVSGPKEV
jgi:hypothetical protein